MSAFHVVVDSSSVIGLTHIDVFPHLPDIFQEIVIPDFVYHEVVVNGHGRPGAAEVAQAVQDGWLVQQTVQDTLAVKALLTNLSQGEAEVIILAQERSCDYALIDEKLARNVAALLGVKTVGVLGVMNMAIVAGIPVQRQQALDTLRRVGFRISNKLYQQMLQP
jgi:predicted nucleic acid-binding protein